MLSKLKSVFLTQKYVSTTFQVPICIEGSDEFSITSCVAHSFFNEVKTTNTK